MGGGKEARKGRSGLGPSVTMVSHLAKTSGKFGLRHAPVGRYVNVIAGTRKINIRRTIKEIAPPEILLDFDVFFAVTSRYDSG